MRLAVGMFLIALALSLPAASAQAAEEEPSPSAVLFGKKCGSCHTLGDGDRTGPDLLGVIARRDRRWLESFIRAPNALIDSGDPLASELLRRYKGVRMPDQQLTNEEMDGLLAYMAECDQKGGCKIVLGKVKHASEATPADVARGQALFEGRGAFARRGPACIACHNVRGGGPLGGGTLARDLTFVYARLGDTGLQAALEATPFPLMKDVYARAPLAADEVFALKAYLAAAAADGTPPTRDHVFLYLGVIGLFAALGAIGAAGTFRLRSVRKDIVRRTGRPT